MVVANTVVWLWEWWSKSHWDFDTTKDHEPQSFVQPIVTLLNGWLAATVAFGASIWGTVPKTTLNPDLTVKSTELYEIDAKILHIKIVSYAVVSLVLAFAVLIAGRMKTHATKSEKPKSRSDWATICLARYSFICVIALAFLACGAAWHNVFPGQQRADDRALPYKFRFDGVDGILVIESFIFDEPEQEAEILATLNSRVSKSWRIEHVDAYVGGRDAIEKPENQMAKPPSPDAQHDNPKKVILWDVQQNKPYTLVFLLHPIDRATKLSRQETIRFLNDYANGFLVEHIAPQKNH